MRILLSCLLVAASASLWARQEPAPVRQAVERFLSSQTAGLPGDVTLAVDDIDPANHLVACTALDVSLPAGARAWGRTHVNVRCLAPEPWSLFVAARVRVVGDYLVAARPLRQGQTIEPGDLGRMRGDLAELPPGILTDRELAVGRTALISVIAGHPLRTDMLRQPLVVRQNQTVRIISRGVGFQVASEGRALGPGSDGEVVQVRLANGQVLSGIARAGGVVEINF
jgi:flagella basal body P-ring formation protein FlgA